MTQTPSSQVYAILVADMVGYSAWLTEQPTATHTAFTHHLRHIFDPSVRHHGGRIVKTTGDGFVAILKSPVAAERCARQIQNALQAQGAGHSGIASLLDYRVAIHSGAIIIEPHDIFGLAVNIAIHMQSLADEGGICISNVIFDQLPPKSKECYKYIGRKYLKNIPDAVSIYATNSLDDHFAASSSLHRRRDRRRSFLSPPPRLGLAELDDCLGSEEGHMSRFIQETLFQGVSRYRELIVAVPLGDVLTTRVISTPLARNMVQDALKLDYVMFGSILRHRNEVILSIYLQDIRNSELIWINKLKLAALGSDDIDRTLIDHIITPALFHLQRNEIDSQDRNWRSVDENQFRVAQRLLIRGTMESTDRARHLLSEILDRCGDVGDVHLALARAEHLHGRLLAGQQFVDALERAREHAATAIEIDDLNAQAHSELALQEVFLRKHTTAAEIYHRALRLNPYDPMLQADWADCLTLMGRAQEALPILERAAAGWPRDRSWVEWNLCDTLWVLDRPDRIVEILDHRSELPHVHRYLAAANAKLGRIGLARQHAERVRGYQPSFSTKEWGKVVPYTESDTGEHYVEFLKRAGL